MVPLYLVLRIYVNLSICVQVQNLIQEYSARGTPVAGVVTEPIQGEGGDNYASPEFFRELQQICKEVYSS